MVTYLNLFFVNKNLKTYVENLREYVTHLTTCAKARHKHYKECIETKKWRNGSDEDTKHKHWREEFNKFSNDCLDMLKKWELRLYESNGELKNATRTIVNRNLSNTIPKSIEKQKKKKDKIPPKPVYWDKSDIKTEEQYEEELVELTTALLADGYDGTNPDEHEYYDEPSPKQKELLNRVREKAMQRVEAYKQKKALKDTEDKEAFEKYFNEQKQFHKLREKGFKYESAENLQINSKRYLQKLKDAYNNDEDNGLSMVQLKPTLIEFLDLRNVDEKVIQEFCDILVLGLNKNNPQHLDHVIYGVIVDDPFITEDDVSTTNHTFLWKGERNEKHNPMPKSNYLKYVYYLSRSYLTRAAIENDISWNLDLLQKILSLYNKNIAQLIGSKILTPSKEYPNITRKEREFVKSFKMIPVSKVNILGLVLLQFYVPSLPDSCENMRFILKRYYEWLVDTEKSKEIKIRYTDDKGKSKTEFITLVMAKKEDPENISLEKAIKSYKKKCK
jgi:hypothetical protein